jgi:undecaprenyl diphosphate synthase
MQKQKKIPNCVGIIMDGNRRWAREKGLLWYKGHDAGYETLKKTIKWCKQADVKNLIVFAMSTENWNRKKIEVNHLLKLLEKVIFSEAESLLEQKIKIKFLGQIERFPKKIQDGIKILENKTKNFKYSLYICLSYGGRAEIMNSVKNLAKQKTKKEIEKIDEKSFEKFLWSGVVGAPDPDIIIRTGKEQRISGFLLWQCAYSELFFPNIHWPDFSKKHFTKILNEFSNRERRIGK